MGHAFGNLFIAALAQITGSFERALEETSRVLAVRGRVLPSTLENVTLCAELADHSMVEGESRIPERAAGYARERHAGQWHATSATNCEDPGTTIRPTPIRRVFLQPERPPVYPEVVRCLQEADLVVLGPGSLYTSIMPNLLVDGLAQALCASRALKIYICNVATQPGETDHYDVVDHVRAIHEHLEACLGAPLVKTSQADAGRTHAPLPPFAYVLVNDNFKPKIPPEWGISRPRDGMEALAQVGVRVIQADVVDEARPTRHDPHKLGRVLMQASAQLRPTSAASSLAVLKGVVGMVRPGLTAVLRPLAPFLGDHRALAGVRRGVGGGPGGAAVAPGTSRGPARS
jgi:hypothetical protein